MEPIAERRWVFISHASRDRTIADTLRWAIENRGLACWIASRDIEPGEGFQDSVVNLLRQSYAMLLVFKQNANNSQEIKKKIALTGQFFVPIIPVRAEDVIPGDAFRYEFATRQWVDAFHNWESAVAVIADKLVTLKSTTPVSDARPSPGGRSARGGSGKPARFRIAAVVFGLLLILAGFLASPRSGLSSCRAARTCRRISPRRRRRA